MQKVDQIFVVVPQQSHIFLRASALFHVGVAAPIALSVRTEQTFLESDEFDFLNNFISFGIKTFPVSHRVVKLISNFSPPATPVY